MSRDGLSLGEELRILDALHRYCFAIDERDADSWLDCFTEDGSFGLRASRDGEWVFRVAGSAELRAWFADYDLRATHANHVILNPRIVTEGDAARAESYYLILRADDGPLVPLRTGRYSDELRRCSDGVWRLVNRIAWVDLGGRGAPVR